MTDFKLPIFSRLEPRTHQFKGGRIVDTDVLTLYEAAKFASNHASAEITQGDFLRAAARGEITLRAIVHRTAKLQKHDGGIYCNQGMPTENTAPQGAILNLPLSACQQLASAGHAAWRTLDGFENRSGELMRFTVARLMDSEPDFETVPGDCRVMGDAVHALADEYIDIQAPPPAGLANEAEPETPAASSGAAETTALPPFRPRIGWQIALFDAWPKMITTYGREPSPSEAVRYLKKHDDSGCVVQKGGDRELWWKPARGKDKEVQFKTVETCISKWRTSGLLPA